jgi:hypothetical protein
LRVGGPQGRLTELEAVIERGLQAFVETGKALIEIRDAELYGEGTFADYCKNRWGWHRSYAYRLMDGARVIENLSPTGDIPKTERVARELAALRAEQQRVV